MNRYFLDASDGTHRPLFPGVVAHIVWQDPLMLSDVRLEPHSVVSEHQHPHTQMGMVIEGRAEFTIGGECRVLGPGDMYRIPGGVPHRVVALDAPVRALDVFHPPREEYK
jgi:quercetin dioxygenase-like cupin family protein